jgi:hypothetical protein
VQEVLDCLSVQDGELVRECFLDSTEAENDLSEGTTETSNNVLSLIVSIDFH